MKLAWLSDIHLEFLKRPKAEAFLDEVREARADGLLLTGDISTAKQIKTHLLILARLEIPIYFLLGNHDFYHGSFAWVDATVSDLCALHANLVHLGSGEIIQLSKSTVLIGHRGWADGRAGLGSRTNVCLNDQLLIGDFMGKSPQETFSLLQKLGDDSVAYMQEILPKAFAAADTVIVATHVPPFPECSLFQNAPSDPEHAPHFVNLALGQALLLAAAKFPAKKIHVYCGHTHHIAHYSPLPNLTVQVAGAEYDHPKIAEIIAI